MSARIEFAPRNLEGSLLAWSHDGASRAGTNDAGMRPVGQPIRG